MAKRKNDDKVVMIRNGILGAVAFIAIAILAYGTYISTGMDEGEIVEGSDYRLVENPRPSRPGGPIEVVEFFSYACIHCKNFDPVIEEWAAEQAGDVTFRRAPANFSPQYALLARAYYTLEQADLLEQHHERLFRAIHDSGRQFLRPADLADWIDGRGISADEFLRQFDSPDVRDAMRKADRDQLAFQISATPQLVVAGKYVVGMDGGQRRALEVLDYLIARERNPAAADSAATN
jgi:thiol:disulfide interchange protein DsbA